MKWKDSRITKVESFVSQSVCALLCSAETECVFVFVFVFVYRAEKVVAVFSGKKREAVFVIQPQSGFAKYRFFFGFNKRGGP